MSKRQRRSRAKPVPDAKIASVERAMAGARRKSERPAPSGGVNPALWANIQTMLSVPDELAVSVDPAVDRHALIQAVLCWNFESELFSRLSKGDAERTYRWLLLCRARAAMDELRALVDDLDPKGDTRAPTLADDPRNTVPVTKEALWRLAHPGRKPEQTNTASRWFADNVAGPHGCDPDPSDPRSRAWVTVNLRLFAAKFGLSLEALRAALP